MTIFLIGVLLFSAVLFVFVRLKISSLAKEDRFFTLVKPKRIKFVTKAGGDVDRYLASLTGENKHIDKKTGDIKEFEKKRSFLSWMFGVEFIGLGKILTYEMELTDKKGNVRKEIASSLYYTGEYYILVEKAETDGQFPVDIFLKITTETVCAGKTTRYKNWLPQVIDPVKAAIRDFVSLQDPTKLMKIQNEEPSPGTSDSKLMELIKSLNSSDQGNPGLEDRVGQKIVAVNILSVEISDTELKKAMEARKKAELEGDAKIKSAEKDVGVAKLEAEKEIELAKGKASAIAKKLKALKGNAQALVGLENANAIRDFKGNTLAINTSTALGISSEKSKEE